MNSNLIKYDNQNEFNKRIKALKKYCKRSYKDVIFNILPELEIGDLTDGQYIREVITDECFEKVHGKISLSYRIEDGYIFLESISPSECLLHMYEKELDCYKGVPITDKKDVFKIDIINIMKGEE